MVIIWLILYSLLFWKLEDVFLASALVVYCLILLFYLYKKQKIKTYGLCKVGILKRDMLFLVVPFLGVIGNNIYHVDFLYVSQIEIIAVIICICTAFLEELFFRGWLLKHLFKKGCVIVSAGIFALSHLVNVFRQSDMRSTLFQVLFAFCVGVSLECIYRMSQSIIPGILLHIGINASALGVREMSDKDMIITLFLGVACMIYIVVFAYTHSRRRKEQNETIY